MLTSHEKIKYSRQTLIKGYGEEGQVALRNAKVLIIGLGGLGNPVSLYLAAAGIGKIFLCDGDNIDLSNLPRQILFSENDVNANKADCSADKLTALNDDASIEVIDEMLDEELANFYFPQVDLVIDCTDNVKARYLINQFCLCHKKPLVIGAATGLDGQHLFVDPTNEESACYQCLFPESEKAPSQNCQTLGILGPVLSIVAGMQSLSAIKYLTGLNTPINTLSLFDGLSQTWQQFKLPKRNNCPACSK